MVVCGFFVLMFSGEGKSREGLVWMFRDFSGGLLREGFRRFRILRSFLYGRDSVY